MTSYLKYILKTKYRKVNKYDFQYIWWILTNHLVLQVVSKVFCNIFQLFYPQQLEIWA